LEIHVIQERSVDEKGYENMRSHIEDRKKYKEEIYA
jgi:hypothetical protein